MESNDVDLNKLEICISKRCVTCKNKKINELYPVSMDCNDAIHYLYNGSGFSTVLTSIIKEDNENKKQKFYISYVCENIPCLVNELRNYMFFTFVDKSKNTKKQNGKKQVKRKVKHRRRRS